MLLLQTLAELYNAARKRQTIALDKVQDFIANTLNAVPAIAFETVDLLPAIELQQTHKLQFWDAVLITTALRAECTLLLSEDGQHQRRFGGLTVLNPILLSEGERAELF